MVGDLDASFLAVCSTGAGNKREVSDLSDAGDGGERAIRSAGITFGQERNSLTE